MADEDKPRGDENEPLEAAPSGGWLRECLKELFGGLSFTIIGLVVVVIIGIVIFRIVLKVIYGIEFPNPFGSW